MSFSLPSFAKVNMNLRVLGKREDGYHEIFTVFQTVSLYDTLTFETGSSGIEMECDVPDIPVDNANLIVRAAKLLKERCNVGFGARIILEKRIPAGGGLGGGSSNAAVALIGLSRLWNLPVTRAELLILAKELGSDVPFFLLGGMVIGTGRGIDLEEIEDLPIGYMLIVTPNKHVSSARAYAELRAQNLTNDEANRILRVCRSEAESPDFLQTALINDFETTVFAAFPEIERVKQRLLELGADRALMSGSGASVFAIFDKEETRQTALKALDNEVNWRKFVVAAVSRAEYREKVYSKL